jgi:hypothetical protein
VRHHQLGRTFGADDGAGACRQPHRLAGFEEVVVEVAGACHPDAAAQHADPGGAALGATQQLAVAQLQQGGGLKFGHGSLLSMATQCRHALVPPTDPALRKLQQHSGRCGRLYRQQLGTSVPVRRRLLCPQ